MDTLRATFSENRRYGSRNLRSWGGRIRKDRLILWGIQHLTDIQMRALAAGVANAESMVISAPTSSGKTLVGELAILSALKSGARSVYLVSHKALADQKYIDFLVRLGEQSSSPIASIGLSTGDRSEGDISAQIIIATYEKAFSLILTGQLHLEETVVIADELQIIGDPGRGPEIETLCTVFRQRGLRQFVALTATVENASDLSGWINCKLVRSALRDVPLHQEIWYQNTGSRTTFGQDTTQSIPSSHISTRSVIEAVEKLLELGRGPVLVFTESRREAMQYAEKLGKRRPRVSDGIKLAEQLDLFSEPTESSEVLRDNAERCVTFHTADLSPQERQVVESGFINSKFQVCFATTTLAAGVNFPFRSIVFPKLTFTYGDRAGSQIVRSDYRNMSGRAGRLGIHEDGYVVLLPENKVELAHANRLVQPDNDHLESQLVRLSLRKSILALISSRLASASEEISDFFQNTLYWYQLRDKNPKKLSVVTDEIPLGVKWLVENELVVQGTDATLKSTALGRATALSGLLPATAVFFANILRKHAKEITQEFVAWTPGLIYAACASPEFGADHPSRFFPYPGNPAESPITYWAAKKLPVSFDAADAKLAQCAQAVVLFVDGMAERKIAHTTGLSSGSIHRLSLDISWILDGLHKLSTVPDLGCSQNLSNQISILARRARLGAPAEVLDVMRLAERHRVPGVGRQRAMALIAQGIKTIHDIIDAGKELLTKLLRSSTRADSLLAAASNAIGLNSNRLEQSQLRLARTLKIEKQVAACNTELGIRYEQAIAELLSIEGSWVVTTLDDGIQQNVPDFLLELGGQKALIECKTCTKNPPLIKKEEAWAVIQKAADYDLSMRRVILGKPAFDETSKVKAAVASDISLIEHHTFVEGLLRVHAGSISPADFMKWLTTPAFVEIDRLSGTPSYAS